MVRRQRQLGIRDREWAPQVAPGGATCGAHSLVFGSGPAPANASASGNLSWPLACSRCNQGVTGTYRWRAFALSRCFADPMAAHHVRSTAHHDLLRCVGGWYCARCQLAVSSSRRAAASRALCPVPVVADGAGAPLPHVMACYSANLAALSAWRARWAAVAPPGIAAPPPVAVVAAPGAVAFAAALAWRPHRVVTARPGGNVTCLCLRCGLWGTRRFPRKLAASACALVDMLVLKCAAKATLLYRAFDEASHRAPVATRERAIFLGWKPVALGTGPA